MPYEPVLNRTPEGRDFWRDDPVNARGSATLLLVLFLLLILLMGSGAFLASRSYVERAPFLPQEEQARFAAYAGLKDWLYQANAAVCSGAPSCAQPTALTASAVSAVLPVDLPNGLSATASVSAVPVAVSVASGIPDPAFNLSVSGVSGQSAAQLEALVSWETLGGAGTAAVAPYNIYVAGNAVFNGGARLENASIGVNGTAIINGGAEVGNVDATNLDLNGSFSAGSFRASQSLQVNGNLRGNLYLGQGGSYFGSSRYAPVGLSAAATTALERALAAPAALGASLDAHIAAMQHYATVSLLTTTLSDGQSSGEVALLPALAQQIGVSSQFDEYSVSGGYTSQWQTFSNWFCGNAYCLSSGGGSGYWSVNGGIASGVNAFLYVQGSLSVNGSSGPAYLSIVATNGVSFNGSANLVAYASMPGVCLLSGNPVCSDGEPNPGLIGLGIETAGGGSGYGITFNGNSTISGSLVSTGGIVINGSSEIDGDIFAFGGLQLGNALVMNGNFGTPIKGAAHVLVGGQALAQPAGHYAVVSAYWR